jgi:hypothetical protein
MPRWRELEIRTFVLCPDAQQLILMYLEDLSHLGPDHPCAPDLGVVHVLGHDYPLDEYVCHLLDTNPWPLGWRVVVRPRRLRT